MKTPCDWFCFCLGIVSGTVGTAGAVPARPHLFISSDDLPSLRERVTSEPFAVRWRVFLEEAEDLLNRSPARSSRPNLGNMGTLAFAYLVTEDHRFAERAFFEAEAAIDRGVWISPRHVRFNRGADLVGSEISLGIALVYDWCHGALSEEQRAALRDALLNESLRRYAISVDGDPREWWFEHEINNWRGVCHGGMGVAALALYHESEEARRLARINREQIPRIYEQVVREDGGGHEGVGYHHYGIAYATYALMAGDRFFDDGATGRTLQLMVDKLAGYWDFYMQGPDLLYANIGRMGGDWEEGLWANDLVTSGGPNAALCALFDRATPGGDRILRWGADNGSCRFYWPGASPFWFLWRRPEAPSLLREPKPERQPAVLFRGAGHAIFQEKDLWLAFSGGRTHNRRDLGAFVLVVGEERFVHIPQSNKVTATAEQSALLVNGNGQQRDARGRFLRFGSDERFHYLAVDLSHVSEDPTLVRHIRHLIMVDGRLVVIVDDVAANEPAAWEARIQTEKPGLSATGNHGRISGQSADLHVLAAVADGDLSIEPGSSVLQYLAIQPESRTQEALIATALVTTDPGGKAPALTLDHGVLKVGTDVLRFESASSGWRLVEVNGVDATGIPTGEERSLVPVRGLSGT